MAYLLGYRDFYRDRFVVRKGCLVPRADTEHLLYQADLLVQDKKRVRAILDVGTGTGCILLSCRHLFPGAALDGLDTHIAVARLNARRLGAGSVRMLGGDIRTWQPTSGLVYDLIFSNPPYLDDLDMQAVNGDVLHEPRRALWGGADGMQYYRYLAARCRQWLAPQGFLIIETDHKWEKVRQIFQDQGWKFVTLANDYNSLPRVLVFTV